MRQIQLMQNDLENEYVQHEITREESAVQIWASSGGDLRVVGPAQDGSWRLSVAPECWVYW